MEKFPDTRAITRDEILKTYSAVFDWRGGIIIAILAGAVLAFLIFAWDKAAGLSAEEKREIGILKAIGWETADVLQMKFWEGLVVSLSAFLAGVILAYLHIFFSSAITLCPGAEGLVHALSGFHLDALYQRLSNRHPVFLYGDSLYRGHHHSLLAGGDDRS